MTLPRPVLRTLTFSLLASALFLGCSGHTLQELIDGKKENDSSSEKPSGDHAEAYQVPPSRNSALNAISPSSTADESHQEYRYLQKSTDDWIEKEWEPLTEPPKSVTESNITAYDDNHNEENTSSIDGDSGTFTLQHYVDKTARYIENKKRRDANKSKSPSHTEKINAMPGIGKKEGRR